MLAAEIALAKHINVRIWSTKSISENIIGKAYTILQHNHCQKDSLLMPPQKGESKMSNERKCLMM